MEAPTRLSICCSLPCHPGRSAHTHWFAGFQCCPCRQRLSNYFWSLASDTLSWFFPHRAGFVFPSAATMETTVQTSLMLGILAILVSSVARLCSRAYPSISITALRISASSSWNDGKFGQGLASATPVPCAIFSYYTAGSSSAVPDSKANAGLDPALWSQFRRTCTVLLLSNKSVYEIWVARIRESSRTQGS